MQYHFPFTFSEPLYAASPLLGKVILIENRNIVPRMKRKILLQFINIHI